MTRKRLLILIILALFPVVGSAKEEPTASREPEQLELWPELRQQISTTPGGFEISAPAAKVIQSVQADSHLNEDVRRRVIELAIQVEENVQQKESAPQRLVIEVNGHRYSVGENVDAEQLRSFKAMPESYQNLFQENRAIFLTRSAQLLSTAFAANLLGSGSVTRSRIQWAWGNIGTLALQAGGSAVNRMEHPVDFEVSRLQQELRESPIKLSPYVSKAFSERRHEAIQNILNGIDHQFWQKNYLTANANEFSAYASIGPTLFAGKSAKKSESGTPAKDWGVGGSVDIGFMIGWNKDSGSAVIQVFLLTEKFRKTMTGLTANAAVVPKVGLMLANVDRGHEMKIENGRVQYPPAPPGVSAYTLDSPRRFAVGANPPIGLIPWPFDSILIYDMNYTFRPLLRWNFRFEVFRDFVSVQAGPSGEFRRFVKSSVLRQVNVVKSLVSGRRMCVSVHTGS